MPGLDGIRALAVLAVIAYHLGFGWASGGLLGVGMFFTLSGYLITDLLLAQWDEQRFEARRLLDPSSAAVVAGAVRDADRGQPVGRGAGPLAADRSARRRVVGGPVHQQLVADLAAHVLLREVRAALAAQPPVVAGGRGAVLSDLAVAAAARTEVRPRAPAADEGQGPPAPGRCDAGPGRGVRDRDGGPVSPQLRRDSDLRRHGHARVRAAVRCRVGDGLAEPRADQEHRAAALGRSSTPPASPACWRSFLLVAAPTSTRRSSTTAGSCCCRWGPCWWLPRVPIRPAASAWRSGGRRCAGSACARTGSICGTSRSSC